MHCLDSQAKPINNDVDVHGLEEFGCLSPWDFGSKTKGDGKGKSKSKDFYVIGGHNAPRKVCALYCLACCH